MRAAGVLLVVVVLFLLWAVLAYGPSPAAPPPRADGERPQADGEQGALQPSPAPTRDRAEATDVAGGDASAESVDPAPSAPGALHRVRVEDPAGEPVPGVPVSFLWRVEGLRKLSGRVVGHTDAEGVLLVDTESPYVVQCREFGWQGPDVGIEDGDVSAPVEGEETVLVTEPGLPVTVAFFDARSGAPVEGGVVSVRGVSLVAEGAEHRAERVGLRRGEWVDVGLEVDPPAGWALVGVRTPAVADYVTESAHELRIDLPLWPGREVQVTVELPDGSRPPGVEWVRLSRAVSGGNEAGNRILSTYIGRLWTRLPTDADANPYTVGTIPTFLRAPIVAAASVSERPYTSSVLTPDSDDDRILLRVEVGTNAVRGAAGRIGEQGRDLPRTDIQPVLGELTGSAALDATVFAHDGTPLVGGFVYLPGATAGRTDASGRVRLDQLPEGEHQVVVREPGFPLTARTVVLERDATTAVRIDADPTTTLTVDVVGDDGRPLPGARLVLRPYGELPYVVARDGVQRLVHSTGADGRAVLAGVPRERAELDVRWGLASQTVSLARDQERVEITLPTRRD